MIARPSYTLTVTPPGGAALNLTQYLAWSGGNQQMTITQNFGRQGDTAVIVLMDEFTATPHFTIQVMSQISLFDNIAGQSIFAGVINDPVLTPQGPRLFEWDLNCTDYTFYADNAVVKLIRIGATLDQIVVDLTNSADCGITAATVADGGFVSPGPVLPDFVLNYTSLSSAWRTLATLGSQATPYGWYVDENRALHFYDQSSALSSGVTFTTKPTAGGSVTEGHMILDSQFQYEWDGTSLYNRILVQGATQTIQGGSPTGISPAPPTDTWIGNGYQTAWPLRYTVSGTPTLYVGGVETTVTVVTPGEAVPAGWTVQQNTVGSFFLTVDTPPTAGTTIQAWYSYQVPVVAQASDFQSQAAYAGPNGGVFAEFYSDSSLTTVPMALAWAMRARQEYAFAAERITFDTSEDWMGWVRAGWTCTIDNELMPDSENDYALGINDTFIVTANRVTFGQGSDNSPYRQCEITAVRL